MRESHAKFVLLALIVVAVFAAWQAPALGYTDLTGDYAWKPLKIGGGGWDVGMWVHPDTPDVVYCRCDVGGAYRWDEAADTWTNVVTADSMPDEAYITYAGVDSIVGAPSDANIAYMAYCRKWWGGAAGDVYRSTNRGDTWTKPGTLGVLMDPNAGGRQEGERLAVDPADADVVYFGSTEDGLWVTTDGAATWSQVSQVPLGGSGHGVNTVVFDPNSGTTGGKTNTVYVTTWGAGVWATTDAGATWSKINGGGPADSLAPHDADIGPDGTYYVCYEESAVWKYSQGSWTNITPGGDPKAWHDVAVDPFDAQRLFITTSAAGSHWRSTDQGASWTELGKSSTSEIDWQDTYRGWSSWMGVGEILFDPHTPDTLWFAESMGVYRTTDINDGSITWQSVSRGLEDTCPNAVACPSGGHPVTAMWDIGVFYHYDPDAYTAKQAQVIHSHGWSLDYCAGQPSFVAAVSQVPDYNVSGYSTDYGETWTSFGATPADHQYVPRGIAVSATDPDNLVWWNSTDNKVWYSTDRGQSWSQGSGFPGQPHDSGWGWGDRQLDSDKVDGGTFYIYNWGSTTDPAYDGGVWRSTDGGATWSRVSTALPEGCEGPIVATPGKAGHVWFCGGLWGQDPLYRSTDHGATWSPVSGTSYATAVGFGKAGGDYPTIYMAGQVDGVHGIWRSTDEGASWARICEYPLGLYTKIKCMDGDPEAFGKLYLGLEGKGFAYGEQTTGDTTPPAAPTGLTATAASESQVNLNWDDNTEGDLDSYNVYRDGSQIATGVASSSYSDTGLSPSTQYCYTVTAVDTSSNESTESAQDCATTLAPGGGDGLTGDYYDNMDFTSHALTRVDPTVNFDWGSGSPDASMGADTFSVRWTGQVEPLYSETYTFTTRSDDGVRLWVNGQSVIDNWTDHGPTYDSGTIALSAGTKYDIQLDYYENGGGAVCQLSWSSASQAEEIIPQSQLYSSGGGDTTPPAAPTNLSASAGDGQVDLNWDDNTEGDLDGYSVYRSTTSGSGYGSIATVYGGSAYSDTGVTNGTTYYYVVTAFDTSANESGYSNEASATPQAAGLPSPWQNQDIGSPSAAGSAGYSSGTFTIEGDGNDIWNNSDNFHYVYQSLSGDGEIEARVASLENTNSWAKAGVMIRESLTGGSTHAMMVVTPGNGTSFQRRTSTGSTSESTTPGDGVTAPYWVRVTRSGDTFTGYKSSDGSSWTQVGSVTISMATDVYIGLPVTSHSDGVLCTAEMDNVTVTSGGGDTTPPAAPTGLTATAASDSQIDLDWDDNTESDLDSYNVYRDGSQIATGVTVSSYSDAGLSAETQYCYTVTAVDTSSNESAQSAQDCATTQAATTADATISEAASAPTIDGSADAVWADTNTYSIANALSGATGGTDLSGQWRALWDSTNLYYLVEVTDDAQVNDSTDAWDDDSVEIYIDADNSKGTSYDGVNDYQLVLRWNDATIHLGTNSATDTTGMDFAIADTADGYTVEVLVPWSTLGVTPAAGNLIGTDVHVNDDDDGGARDGKISWFAMVDNSWSDPSTFAEAELVAGEADTTPPANPTGLSATAGDGQVDLNWDDNTEGDLASYSVYRSTTSGSGYSSIATGVASSAYTDTGVTNGTTYYYVVTAVDTSSNESGYSNEASATPEAGPAFAVKVNFQPSGSTVPDGYVADVSQTYGDRGNGYTYGWEASFDETRDRDAHSDQRYDTLNHLQLDGTSHYWEIAVPDGTHDVWLVCGDPSYTDQVNDMVVEGTSCNDPDGQDNFDEYSVTVNVTDGRLTIEAAGSASNSKVCFVEITQQ